MNLPHVFYSYNLFQRKVFTLIIIIFAVPRTKPEEMKRKRLVFDLNDSPHLWSISVASVNKSFNVTSNDMILSFCFIMGIRSSLKVLHKTVIPIFEQKVYSYWKSSKESKRKWTTTKFINPILNLLSIDTWKEVTCTLYVYSLTWINLQSHHSWIATMVFHFIHYYLINKDNIGYIWSFVQKKMINFDIIHVLQNVL